MSPDAVILILEDEKAQILALRAQLKGLGTLVEFSDPAPALEYARRNPCDAAIVDIGMPRASMDGLDFLRALREFDRELAIIIRTGSDSDQIADSAIELRAIKRAVKSKTTLAELRRSTQEAIRETRARREAVRNAQAAAWTKSQLAEALGTYDLRLAVGDLHRGLVHTLRNRLTALSALASLIQADAGRSRQPEMVEHAGRSAQLVAAMVDSVNAFLDGPFGDGSASSEAGINPCLDALRQFFKGAERWAAEGKRVVLKDLISDTRVGCAPLELMNGIRHLVEFFLVRAGPGTEVALAASILLAPEPLAGHVAAANCVLNRDVIGRDHPQVALRVSVSGLDLSVDQLRDAFSTGGENTRTGDLAVMAQLLSAARGAVLIGRSAAGTITVETLLPVAL